VAILKATISSTMITTRVVSLNLMEYARVYPIPISTRRLRTIIKTQPLLVMDADVVLGMIPILVITGRDEGIIHEGEEDILTPMATGMIIPAEDITKIKGSRDLYSLLSHLDITVVVGVEEVIINEVNITIMVLHFLLDHQGIEVHLDIIVLLLQDLMEIIGIMDHPLLLDMDHLHPDSQVIGIISHLLLLLGLDIIGLHLLLLDASISRAHLRHLDVDMGVDLPLLDIGMDIMDHLLSLQDQDTMDPLLPVDMGTIEDQGPKVLMEELIEALHSLDISAVLAHPLHASVRSMASLVVDLLFLDIKGMAI